jgi:RimJ/RimL family protein N-acetyltransferase
VSTAPVLTESTYENEKVALLTYWEGPNSPFPETFLSVLYAKTKEDGLIGRVFPGMQIKTLNQFIHHMNGKPLVVGYVKGNPPQIAGYGWLWETQGTETARKSSFGFCFLKKFFGSDEIRQLARMALHWWFVDLKVQVLYGATLESNRQAIAFAKEIGFTVIGKAPKFFTRKDVLVDACLVFQERDDFLKRMTDGRT